MPLIVCDTSPLRALAFLRLAHLPMEFFGDVVIPPCVLAELNRSIATQGPIGLVDIPGARLMAPSDHEATMRLRNFLDAGEAEAICLAEELRASALLMDEVRGRTYAKSRGIEVIGAVGLLVRAKRRGTIAEVGSLLDRLQSELRFFIAPALMAEALRQANEA